MQLNYMFAFLNVLKVMSLNSAYAGLWCRMVV